VTDFVWIGVVCVLCGLRWNTMVLPEGADERAYPCAGCGLTMGVFDDGSEIPNLLGEEVD
jgi:polyferredoxin